MDDSAVVMLRVRGAEAERRTEWRCVMDQSDERCAVCSPVDGGRRAEAEWSAEVSMTAAAASEVLHALTLLCAVPTLSCCRVSHCGLPVGLSATRTVCHCLLPALSGALGSLWPSAGNRSRRAMAAAQLRLCPSPPSPSASPCWLSRRRSRPVQLSALKSRNDPRRKGPNNCTAARTHRSRLHVRATQTPLPALGLVLYPRIQQRLLSGPGAPVTDALLTAGNWLRERRY